MSRPAGDTPFPHHVLGATHPASPLPSPSPTATLPLELNFPPIPLNNPKKTRPPESQQADIHGPIQPSHARPATRSPRPRIRPQGTPQLCFFRALPCIPPLSRDFILLPRITALRGSSQEEQQGRIRLFRSPRMTECPRRRDRVSIPAVSRRTDPTGETYAGADLHPYLVRANCPQLPRTRDPKLVKHLNRDWTSQSRQSGPPPRAIPGKGGTPHTSTGQPSFSALRNAQ